MTTGLIATSAHPVITPMNSAAFTLDRLTYIDQLKSGGVDEHQARAHAVALEAALRDSVATRSDVDALRADIRAVEIRLEAKIDTAVAGVKVDILRWRFVTQAALGGSVCTAFKFVH